MNRRVTAYTNGRVLSDVEIKAVSGGGCVNDTFYQTDTGVSCDVGRDGGCVAKPSKPPPPSN